MPHPSAFIHAMAVTDGSVSIGDRTKVWQFASVIRGAILGEGCTVGAGAVVDGGKIGDRCAVGAGAKINPGCVIGNDVFVGPGAIICNDVWPSISKEGFDLDRMLAGDFVTVRILDGAVVSAGAIILPGITIGRGAMIAAGAVVDRDVTAGTLWYRDGRLHPLPLARSRHRMREAKCSTS